MAGLQSALRRQDEFADVFADAFEDDSVDTSPAPRRAPEQDNSPMSTVRPRIGTGPRGRGGSKRRRAEGATLWRVLAVSIAVLVVGTGGLLAIHALRPGDSGYEPQTQSASGEAGNTQLAAVPADPVQAAAPDSAAPQAPAAEASTAQDSVHTARVAKVASIFAAPPAAPAAAPQAAPQKAMALSPATPSLAPPAAATEPGPTAADLARPAFVEPVTQEEEEEPVDVAAAPLPPTKPTEIASADTAPKDADARAARISMDVTLRSGPRRSASAIGTLSEGTKVTLYSCKSWCEVSSGDKRGFVYRDAVAR